MMRIAMTFSGRPLAVVATLVLSIAASGCASGPAGAPRLARDVAGAATRPVRVLRVCADPNNLPFTNRRLEGFENKIAELVAREMGATLEYTWRAQHRGFFRHALGSRDTPAEAELVLGVPARFEMALTTTPYYRSTYVFVAREDRNLDIRSFDDPALRTLKIGVPLVGDEGTNTPPALALARRGLAPNVVGFTVYGDYTQENPPARIIDALAKGEIDLAVAWGPLGGYFAKRASVPMVVTPVSPQFDPPGLPFAFDIAMGVRKADKPLRDEIEAILWRRRADVERILDEYGVPRVPAEARPAEPKTDQSQPAVRASGEHP